VIASALLSGFTGRTDEATVQVVRIGAGLAVSIKAAVSIGRGGWSRLEPGRLGRFRLERDRGPVVAGRLAAVHRPLLVLTLLAGVALALGLQPKPACLVVAAGLLHELSYDYRFNTLFLLMLDGCLVAAGALGHGLRPVHQLSSANTWSQFLIMLLAVDLYLASAFAKARSVQFRSGRLLAQLVHVAILIRPRLPRWEYSFPAWLAGWSADPNGPVPGWRAASYGVIAAEALLPFGLLYPPTRSVAWVVGIGMHVAFTAIMPARLLPFSIASVSTYVAFS
jgi:hypothetical protein